MINGIPSTLTIDGICYIEITNEENGKPQIHFVSLTKEVEKEISKIQSIDISLSHLKEYATANVAIII